MKKIKDFFVNELKYIIATVDADLLLYFKYNYLKILALSFAILAINTIFLRSSAILRMSILLCFSLLFFNTLIIIQVAHSKIYILTGTVVKTYDDNYHKSSKSKKMCRICVQSDLSEFYYIIKLPLVKYLLYPKGTSIKCFIHESCITPKNDNTATISRYIYLFSNKTDIELPLHPSNKNEVD